MYVNTDLGFDFGALVSASAPLVETGVKTYGQIQTIKNQPRAALNMIPQQQAAPQVIVQQPAPVAAPQPKSKVGQYLTIGALLLLGIGGGVYVARRRSRR